MASISLAISTLTTATKTHDQSIEKAGKASLGFGKGESWDFARRPQNYCRSLNSFHWSFNPFPHGHTFPASPLAISSRGTCEIHQSRNELGSVCQWLPKYTSFTSHHQVNNWQILWVTGGFGEYKSLKMYHEGTSQIFFFFSFLVACSIWSQIWAAVMT